jgi:hypothetical protein
VANNEIFNDLEKEATDNLKIGKAFFGPVDESLIQILADLNMKSHFIQIVNPHQITDRINDSPCWFPRTVLLYLSS